MIDSTLARERTTTGGAFSTFFSFLLTVAITAAATAERSAMRGAFSAGAGAGSYTVSKDVALLSQVSSVGAIRVCDVAVRLNALAIDKRAADARAAGAAGGGLGAAAGAGLTR